MWKITGENITQRFNHKLIFKNISFLVESGSSIVLMGPNGSGKTTLVRIIVHLVRPTAGEIRFSLNESSVGRNQISQHIGLVGPYLQLYNNLTALENYLFFARIRGLKIDLDLFKSLMKRLGLKGRENDELRAYSSGMLQRAKYVMALIHDPHILILDEPTANLDEEGAGIVYSIMEEQKKDKILIIATNEPDEFRFGDEKIKLVS